MSGVLRWSEEHLRAHQAKRARECAVSDSVAEVIPYGTPIKPPKPRDMFGRPIPALLESDVLPSVLAALRVHPKVAWCARMNVGAMKVDDPKSAKGYRFIRYGWRGMVDITGQLKDGRRLEVEAKRVGNKASDEQDAFMQTVNRNGGKAFVAFGVEDVFRELEDAT